MLDFYYADTDYVNFLRTIDKQVPYQNYANHDKFVCGVIFEINDIKYYAPVSHYAIPDRTSYPIKNKTGQTIASIRSCFMFPVPDAYITMLNFRALTVNDRKYTDLVRAEYDFCKKNADRILKHAKKVYKDGCNRNLYIAKFINNFPELEAHYLSYVPPTSTETPIKEIKSPTD